LNFTFEQVIRVINIFEALGLGCRRFKLLAALRLLLQLRSLERNEEKIRKGKGRKERGRGHKEQ
jgi:hypothetical protein